MMDQNNQELLERREARRKRRQRNQIIAYVTVIAIIAVLGTGVVFGVRFLSGNVKHKEEVQQSQEAAVADLLAKEETIEITPEEEPEEVPVELTPQQKLDEIVNAGIEAMPLEDKVAGLFIVTPEDITGVSTAVKAGDGTREALSQYSVGGLVYFKKNMQSKDQLKEMLENTRNYSSYPLFLAVDEEGGEISRVAQAGLADGVDSAAKIGETGDPNNAYQAGVTIGTYLSELGFNLNFAPVADLTNVENSIMEGRAYGSEAAAVTPFVTSMMKGLNEQGVTACLKHFPGMGGTTEDTHEVLVIIDKSKEEFQDEFAVFRAGMEAGANMIMVEHVSAPKLTGENNTPCTLSKTVVTDILRDELGYDGVIITDALNMAAITEYYAADEAAVLALKAGCDMLLMPEDFETAYEGVLQAVKDGVVSEERINDSLRRIYRIKYADKLEE